MAATGQWRADQMIEGAEGGFRALADGDHGGEDARHRGLAARIHFDLAAWGQLNRALQPIGVRHESDLDEDAGKLGRAQRAALAVLVHESVHPLSVARDFGGLGAGDHAHVRQAVELAREHRIGAQPRFVFDQRDVADDAGEIDRRLDAGIAAADHRDPLALEQRAVAVRAVGHAPIAVLALSGDVERDGAINKMNRFYRLDRQ